MTSNATASAAMTTQTRHQPPPEMELSYESETLTDRAYRELEELIVTLRIAPGTVVSEALLSKRLGIGRTPVREALQRLARERLVVIMPRRGIVVSEVNVETQLRLLETRRELERLLVRSAAKRASEQQRQAFRDIGHAMFEAARAGDDKHFLRCDREFNLLILAAARNEFATSAMALMHGLSRRFWFMHYKGAVDLPEMARMHADIANAIAAGDRDEAACASDLLMDRVEAFTRGTLTSS